MSELLRNELAGLAVSIALVGVISIFIGSFWWMTGVVVAGWAIGNAVRYLEMRNAHPKTTNN